MRQKAKPCLFVGPSRAFMPLRKKLEFLARLDLESLLTGTNPVDRVLSAAALAKLEGQSQAALP